MPTLERNGATIGYDVSGDGPAMILGHSLLCDRTSWQPVVPALARTHRVYNVDFRGHGASVTPGPYSFDDLVEDWLAIMDREGIERAVVGGVSMGGMTGMRLALRAPERVSALVLIDSNAARETWFRRLKYRILARLFDRGGMTDGLLARVAPIMFSATTMAERPDVVQSFAATVRSFDRKQLGHAIRAVNGRGPIGDISAINAPTLVVVGEEDVATPVFRSEFIHRRIAGSTLVKIPGAGHLSVMERPDAIAEALTRFLGAHQDEQPHAARA